MQPSEAARITPASPPFPAEWKIHTKLFFGAQIQQHANDLSRLLGIYSEYPYLYQQDKPLDDVNYIMERYVQQPDSVVCIIFDDNRPIGAAMGVPLSQAPSHYQEPFSENKYNRSTLFYWGELVVQTEYRNHKIAHTLYTEMGENIIQSKKYSAICFATVERDPNFRFYHLKPKDYADFDPLWTRLGFVKEPSLRFNGKWQLKGEKEETLQPMIFWKKNLA